MNHFLKAINFTAAHCISLKFDEKVLRARDISVVFGAHNLNNREESGRYELIPKRIIIHEDYDARSVKYDADLALLRFAKRGITFNLFVRPICLWNFETNPAMKTGEVAGWGKSENPEDHEIEPKMIETPIHSDRKCLTGGHLKIAELSSERTFCAGLQNGTGLCVGDSGSGLVFKVKNTYYLKGIVSSSLQTVNDECDVYQNTVFADLLEFKDWILDETDLLA